MTFDPDEVAYVHETGLATIEGQAVMRREDGTLEPCYGTVVLLPAGSYGDRHMQEVYGSTEAANLNINDHGPIIVTPDLRAYLDTRREATCDTEGRFRFEGLANGGYFLTTSVEWWEGDLHYGGHLM